MFFFLQENVKKYEVHTNNALNFGLDLIS